ncbi:DUF4862 family protein [Obesumbacterium proteus]|uniref:DUF4862 family protein n=1 Tax=Obesumbacterium proteus TaxID=82983 RepID=UPI00242F0CAD|nr:DUF4862 family protein [Obesumbacterium proteus]
MNHNHGFIVGAYPCAPSFHQLERDQETAFWRGLADVEGIGGIEQPCLENLHPYGDDYLFQQIPADWQIVVTAVMETMRRRAGHGGFGLASADKDQRLACVEYYRHILNKINRTNDRFGMKKILALEIQSAPLAGSDDVALAAECFAESMQQITRWDWPCELVIEHCDAMNKSDSRKGFLPLEQEIAVIQALEKDVGIAINWARSAIEGRSMELPLQHLQQSQQAGVLKALMFSGTTTGGTYGDWQDLHAPFAPFASARVNCAESLMTVELASEMFALAPLESLSFAGIKLLEIDPQASVAHRIDILRDGINALNIATRNK